LHKRGYRENANEAPLKETLAAAMVKISRYDGERAFYDPFCGSGTILIEAAMIANNIAPGLNRHFSADKWKSLRKDIWLHARNEALDNVTKKQVRIQGYDIDEAAVRLTLENAKRAWVDEVVTASCQSINNFAPSEPRGIIVCNPPYGERMLEINEAEDLYRKMGQSFLQLNGYNFYIICANERFENLFGRMSDKKRKLYNGMIKCELFQYFRGR
jgi:putative N6-adenine-specific DNA methylase